MALGGIKDKMKKKKDKKAKEVSPVPTVKGLWKNKERVMVLCSRGCSHQQRHLMKDFCRLLPHSKTDSKLDKNQDLRVLNEICDMRSCSKCFYLECRKKSDLYLWVANVPQGPTVKLLLRNVHTTGELRLTGNCLKGSRTILCFDAEFEKEPHLVLLKQILSQTLSTPHMHPRSQPFLDHIFNFSLSPDKRIWFRNYQIVDENTAKMEEIGPRMVMEVIKIFAGSFEGPILYKNDSFVHPNLLRRQKRIAASSGYERRKEQKDELEMVKKNMGPTHFPTPLDDIFSKSGAMDSETQEIKERIERKIVRPKKKDEKNLATKPAEGEATKMEVE